MLTRDDVERITEQVLKELELELDTDFTNPNRRIIILKFRGQRIDSVSFDVVQTQEYEG